jgi:membrane associated rhomboid family serine protease
MFQNLFRNMSPVVKNLLILNVLFFAAQFAVPGIMNNLELYPVVSEEFKPWQLVTHFFMHSTHGLMHIFFNMFALVMFGSQLEQRWGPKRFLIYYFATALGAALLHLLVGYLRLKSLESGLSPAELNQILTEGFEYLRNGKNYVDPLMGQLNLSLFLLYNTPVIGASGAVFGLLAAFGYLFPNTELYLMFIPVPIKAKYFVIGYAAIELYSGIANNPGDNVAHFAHLGGALVGIIMVLIWQRQKNQFN